jgi:hypothetical protein
MTITQAQRIRYEGSGGQVTVVSKPVPLSVRRALEQALADHIANREAAGPGWGSHNAIVRAGTTNGTSHFFTGEEPAYGDWLVTIR